MPSIRPSLIAAILLFAAPTTLVAAPPTETEAQQKVQEFYKGYDAFKMDGQPTPEQIKAMQLAMGERAEKLLEGIEVAELSDDGRKGLQPLLSASPKHRAMVDQMLATKAASKDAAGFTAACERINYVLSDGAGPSPAMTERVLAAIDHPAAVDAAKSGQLGELMWYVGQVPKEQMGARGQRLADMATALVTSDAPDAAMMAPSFYASLSTAIPRDTFEPSRVIAVDALKKRLATETDEKKKKSLTRGVKVLEGAAMRGELVDHPVPNMTFLKVFGADSSGAQVDAAPWKSLADLKGKVVVLDFWATWCGPCVGSFPKVKELRSQYPASDLEIVGVTSLQGFVVSPDHEKIDCKGDAAKEQAELAKFLNAMGVTWTVGLSEQDVFNPDFGIQGIPHIAIIDQNGVVRKTGLHPMNHDEIVKTIDELLKKTPSETKKTTSTQTTR
ncbi:MAG: TlpA disulfide reductase family protein [Phycisphaerae bacterium]|nr:TlpA disulfide reductase family protein [Phycisphaerae bacterium]